MASSDLTQNIDKREGVGVERNFDLPTSYGDNKIVLMVRDPWTVFSYWEIRKDVEDKVRNQIAERGLKVEKSVLRAYDITENESDLDSRVAFSFDLKNWVDRWYINTGTPGRKWMVEVGIMCTNGEFFCLVRSNKVEAPRYGMSDIYDEEWMSIEELYGKMALGTSSLEMIGESSFTGREK